MQLFEDENGNLRPVSGIKLIRSDPQKAAPFQPPVGSYVVHLLDGSSCTIALWEKMRLERIPATMLPAAPDTYLLSPPGNPGDDVPDPWRTPVIAWAITGDGELDPYTAEGRNGGVTDTPPILFPNGMVMDPHNQSWRNEADWIRHVLDERRAKELGE
jgi:hypothetical protein